MATNTERYRAARDQVFAMADDDRLDAETAGAIMEFVRDRVAPHLRVRRVEFDELPKTISGKIRRVELRAIETERRAHDARGTQEFWEEDFPEIAGEGRVDR